ncbi:MAG: VOC family protein [Candidatus Azotimanducaceae bacterium WSBS_2022_MAG_OTU7]
MTKLTFGYANFFVSDFERSVRFFRDQLGLRVLTEDASFGYASFDTGPAQIAFVKASDQPELVGRHTGIGLIAEDIHLAYEEMRAAGVEFEMPPSKQPWGGVLALFKDPDGNIFYLDEIPENHP